MNLLCLVPTYGRPKLAANAVAQFAAQDYPAGRRRMLVFDDAAQCDAGPVQGVPGAVVMVADRRCATLPAKYDAMLQAAGGWWDAVIVWDDDDVYAPWHLSRYAEFLENHGWAHPAEVWSDYTGSLAVERAAGRFHGALGVRRDLLDAIGGGWIQTARADFDQQMIRACAERGGAPGRPDAAALPSYCFRWASTGAGHCQGLMFAPANEDWYGRVPIAQAGRVGPLVAEMDQDTKTKLATLTAWQAQLQGAKHGGRDRVDGGAELREGHAIA